MLSFPASTLQPSLFSRERIVGTLDSLSLSPLLCKPRFFPRMDNQNDDGLEIVAIGSLYRGPWVKKYWSCSRGKDRYPYPVGYQAVRTCAGDTYRMEIHEGSKGPLFLVAAGGKSVTGQTPDIAWGKFNKENNCRVKIWHGKRFSCKIDGIQLFGFTNPFVQRLLRELVADEHRLTESSLILPSCKDSLTLEKQNSNLHRLPDLLVELQKQETSGKKWKKQRSKAFHSRPKRQKTHDPSTQMHQGFKCESQTRHCEGTVDDLHERSLTSHKISREDDPSYDDYVCKTKISGTDWSNKLSFSSPLEEEADETCILPTNKESCSLNINHAIAVSSVHPTLRYDNEGNTKLAEAKDGFPTLESYHSLYHCCEKEDLAKDSGDLCSYKEMHVFLQGRDCTVNEDKNDKGEQTFTLPNVLTSNLVLVPDSFELTHDNTACPVLGNNKRNPEVASSEVVAVDTCLLCSSNGVEMHMSMEGKDAGDILRFNLQKEEAPPAILKDMSNSALPAFGVPASEGSYLKSQSDEENHVDLGTQYSGSERSDSDIMGKEFAKSMMEVLLPQALPLLKYSRRKKVNRKMKLDNIKQGASQDAINIPVKDHGAFNSSDVLCKDGVDSESSKEPEAAVKNQLQVLGPHLEVDVDPIIADSLEDDTYADLLTSHTPLSVNLGKADVNPVGDSENQWENSNLLGWDFETLKMCSPKSRQAGECLLLSNATKAGEFHEFVPHDFASRHSNASASEDRNSKNNNENHCKLKGFPFISESDEPMPIVVPKSSNKSHSSASCASIEFKEQKDSGSSSNEGDDHSLRSDSAMLCLVAETVETRHVGLQNDCQDGPENNIPNANFANLHISFKQEDSSIHGQCYSPVEDTSDLLNLECGIQLLETDGRMFVSKTSDTHLKDLQGATSSSEHALASPNVKGHPCMPFFSDAKELDQSKMVTDVGTANAFMEKLFDNTTFEPQISQHTVVEGNFAVEFSSPNGNKLTNHFCDVDVERAIPAESISMGISVMDGDAVDTAKNGEVMGCTSIPYIQKEKECKLNVLEEEDVLNVSRKPDFLSLPAKDCCPALCFEKPVNIPVKRQTCFTGDPSNKVVPDQRDDILLNERKPETVAFNHLNSMSTKCNNSSTSCIDLVSCCVSPIPVSSMLLKKQRNGVLLCVICGLPEEMSRTLFVYAIPDKELTEKYPSFHGYAPIQLPLCSYSYDQKFPGERSKIQFIPDGKLLVLLDSIRTPWCSKRDFGCLCSVCKAASQGSSVKVVSVKAGYMSVLAKLKVVETSHCLLVCEPCYLVAAQKWGKLHVWVMNTTWSMDVEEFTLPYFTDTAIMVELEKMPNWPYLIIGHDCVGRFGLWDVSRRVLLAKFSYSGCSIHHFVPFGFFSGAIPSVDEVGHQAAVLSTSELSFWGPSGKSACSPMESEDVAVWLLVSTVSCDTYWSNHCFEGSDKSYTGCWRLALLLKDMLILGNTVDTRSSAANVLPGYGIIGRIDGHVYLWKLTSGHKVAYLNNLKGARVSCIAADASSNTFAVASADCRVFLYMCSSSPWGS
ncbi:uncharacterized protein LOC116259021 isoform X2 [Nymphaea colorata]|uniref:uncharacterized protein LOC116259021 isoform X2 n=1 Tax=Nymphaea colorata TaxID=210225 RepID=UPI00129EBE97|nr:uncharacterized protein LOC116259021 isoform X2 [Nymphaea colorata]